MVRVHQVPHVNQDPQANIEAYHGAINGGWNMTQEEQKAQRVD
jgi:hypothetical protein